MLQNRLNQFFPTKSCVMTLWIGLYDPKQFDRVQRAENQSLRFQNSCSIYIYIHRYFLFVPGNQLFTAQQQKYLLLENCNRNINPSIVKHKGWCEHLSSVLHDLFENLLMTSINGCSKNILSDPREFCPSISPGIPPTPPCLFPMVSTF